MSAEFFGVSDIKFACFVIDNSTPLFLSRCVNSGNDVQEELRPSSKGHILWHIQRFCARKSKLFPDLRKRKISCTCTRSPSA